MGYNLCSNLRNLNVPFSINMGAGVEFKNYNASNTFANCLAYNAPFDVPYFTENCAEMFNNCREFDSPLNITESSLIKNMVGMFTNCLSYNQDIIIPSSCENWYNMAPGYFVYNDPRYHNENYHYHGNVHIYATQSNGYNEWTWGQGYHWVDRDPGDYSYGLSSFTRFNGNVVFHHPVINLYEFYYGCGALNRVVPIPRGTEDVAWMFGSCYSFNAPQTFPNTIKDARSIFISCVNLNRRIDLPDNISANSAFEMCYNLNTAQRIPRNSSISYMFWSCYNYNVPTYIPYCRYDEMNNYRLGRDYRRHHTYDVFYQCSNFNAPVTFDSAIEGLASSMFSGTPFNQPITLPSSLKYDGGIFGDATAFNSSVTYPDCTEVMESSFQGCYSFNQPIHLPSSLLYATDVFDNCYKFNQSVSIPGGCKVVRGMFHNCRSLSHMPSIPLSVNDIGGMFTGCSSLYTSFFNIGPQVNECSGIFNWSLIVNFNLQMREGSYGCCTGIVNVAFAGNTFGKTPSGYHFDGNNIVGSGLGDPIGTAHINGDCKIYDYRGNYVGLLKEVYHPSTVISTYYQDFNGYIDGMNTYSNFEPQYHDNYNNMRFNHGAFILLDEANHNNWDDCTFLFLDYRNASQKEDVKMYWYKVVLY